MIVTPTASLLRAGGGWLLILGAVFLAIVFAGEVHAEVSVPPLKARVTDLTNTLTADQRAALEAKLATFENRKGSQVAVLMVPTTQPEAMEQYSIRVAEQWKLGRKGVDDGILLLIAKNDRKMRLEVGRGLEGAIPDAIAKRIVSDVIAPRFKEGDFYGGITAGTDRLIKLIEGEPMPPVRNASQQSSNWVEASGPSILAAFAVIAALVLAIFLQAVFGLFLGTGIAGIAAGVAVNVFAGTALAVSVGLIVFVISLFIGAAIRAGGFSSPSDNWSSSDPWSSGKSWNSGDSGFSGGGGGFGGGGASGGW